MSFVLADEGAEAPGFLGIIYPRDKSHGNSITWQLNRLMATQKLVATKNLRHFKTMVTFNSWRLRHDSDYQQGLAVEFLINLDIYD